MGALVAAAGIGGVLVCFVAAIASLPSVIGLRGGWVDATNSFAPLQVAAGLLGGVLARLCLGPGALSGGACSLGAVAVIAGLTCIVPELLLLRPPQHRDGDPFRILSANVWHDNPTPAEAVSSILVRDADAVFLQEARGTLLPQLSRLHARYPYVSQCRHSGLRIFAKTPIVTQGCSCERAVSSRGRLVWVSVSAIPGATITLATTHFSHPYQLAQEAERKSLAAELGDLNPHDLILAGDFNCTPWSEGIRGQDAMLTPLRRRTISWFSWPARLERLGLPWPLPVLPIDHIYTGPSWGATRLQRVRIAGSDHFATEATIYRSRAVP
jgi:vancomycin resistance protein VanJ